MRFIASKSVWYFPLSVDSMYSNHAQYLPIASSDAWSGDFRLQQPVETLLLGLYVSIESANAVDCFKISLTGPLSIVVFTSNLAQYLVICVVEADFVAFQSRMPVKTLEVNLNVRIETACGYG